MIKDELKSIGSFKSLKLKCPCCKNPSHFIDKCPIIHYAPDRDFIIKRFLFSSNQVRNKVFSRNIKRKAFHAVFDSNLIQEKSRLMINDMSFADSDSCSDVSNETCQKEDLEIIRENLFEEKEEGEKRNSSANELHKITKNDSLTDITSNTMLDPLKVVSLKNDRKRSSFIPTQMFQIGGSQRKSHQSVNSFFV